jgi:hypothetical protein
MVLGSGERKQSEVMAGRCHHVEKTQLTSLEIPGVQVLGVLRVRNTGV